MTTVENALRDALRAPETPVDTLADRVREIADNIRYGKHGIWLTLDIDLDPDQVEYVRKEANALAGTLKPGSTKERFAGALLSSDDIERVLNVLALLTVERASG